MKIRLSLIACMFLILPLGAAGDQMMTQSYEIGKVRYVEVGSAVRVEIRQSDTESLRAQGSSETLKRGSVTVKGERLILGVEEKERGFFDWFGDGANGEVTFVLEVSELAGLKLGGAARADVESIGGAELAVELGGSSRVTFERLSFDRLELSLSGASQLRIGNVEAEQLDLSMAGASRLEIDSEARAVTLDLDLSGSSKYLGRAVVSERARAKLSGSSRAELGRVKELQVHASGSSKLRYAGAPQIQQKISGSSRISAR